MRSITTQEKKKKEKSLPGALGYQKPILIQIDTHRLFFFFALFLSIRAFLLAVMGARVNYGTHHCSHHRSGLPPDDERRGQRGTREGEPRRGVQSVPLSQGHWQRLSRRGGWEREMVRWWESAGIDSGFSFASHCGRYQSLGGSCNVCKSRSIREMCANEIERGGEIWALEFPGAMSRKDIHTV